MQCRDLQFHAQAAARAGSQVHVGRAAHLQPARLRKLQETLDKVAVDEQGGVFAPDVPAQRSHTGAAQAIDLHDGTHGEDTACCRHA